MSAQTCEATTVPTLRVLGVHKAASHTAQSQLAGWAHQVDLCYQLLNESPLEPGNIRNSRDFASKLRGISTDHAADQKKLVELVRVWKAQCNREICGEAVLQSLSKEALAQRLSENLEEVLAAVAHWDDKSPGEQSATVHAVWHSLVLAAGDKAIEELTDAEKQDMELFVWTGCCMHKELNAVKGGVARMMKMWAGNNLIPPIALRNKFEAIKTDNNAHPREESRGAVKLASLLGAILNNKDDKKGQHETYRFSFQVYHIILSHQHPIDINRIGRNSLGTQQHFRTQATHDTDPIAMLPLNCLSIWTFMLAFYSKSTMQKVPRASQISNPTHSWVYIMLKRLLSLRYWHCMRRQLGAHT